MQLIVDCLPRHRLADLAPVKLALLELGYTMTITRAGDLYAHGPQDAPPPAPRVESIHDWRRWPPRGSRG